MALIEITFEKTPTFILTRAFARLLQSGALVSELMEKIGAQFSHSQVIPAKDISGDKFGNETYKDKHLVALLSLSDTESTSEALDADSAIYDKQKSSAAEKTTNKRSRQKKNTEKI